MQKSIVFCNSPLLNQTLNWLSDRPQLTDCFTQTILPVIPLTVLLTLLPYDLYLVYKSAKKLAPIPYQWKNKLILLTITCLSIISITNITKTLWQYFSNEIYLLIISELFCQFIKLITYLLLTILVLIFRKNGYRNSSSIPIQWLCTLFVVLINLYQFFTIHSNDINNQLLKVVLNCLEVFFVFNALIISSLTPEVSEFQRLDNDWDRKCPFHEHNIFSRIFFVWLKSILKIGYKTTTDLSQHLSPICYYLKSKNSFNSFESANNKYNSTKSVPTIKLLPLLWSTAWIPYLFSVVLELLWIVFTFIQPYYLSKLIDFVQTVDVYIWHGIYYAIAYCLSNLITCIFNVHVHYMLYLATYRVKSSVVTSVYCKMLKLSAGSRREYTTGEINNLMGVDIEEVCTFLHTMNSLFSIPISVAIGLYILWQQLGPSSLTLIGVMLIVGPLTTCVMKRIDSLQTKQMELKDKRMAEISEILNNIKLLKLFGWEKPFIDRVTQTRRQELSTLNVSNYYWSAIEVLWSSVGMVIAGITFTVYTLISGQILTAKMAFVSLSVLSLLRSPMAQLPGVLTHLVRAYVSYKRIRKYLSCEELDENSENYKIDENLNKNLSIALKNCSFAWNRTEDPVLKNINLKVRKGSLVAIVGKVGTGKSSLFSAILGDMYPMGEQQTQVLGSMAYVPQTPFIQNRSLKQNITFISDFDSTKYEKVVTACALKPDFDLLPARDMTEIGEKGINLSGGQKSRVSLARAVYQDSDVYLLDDPLSAVDAHVAQQLFQQVIGPKGLLHKKTRLLATHHISFLRDADLIIVMSAGRIIGSGSYDDLYEKDLLSEEVLSASDTNSMQSGDTLQRQTSRLSANESTDRLSRQISRQLSKQSDSTADKYESLKERMEKEAELAQLIDEEKQEFGSIKFAVYVDYIRRIGIWFSIIGLLTALAFNLCEVGGNYWLNIWTSQNSTLMEETSNRNYYLGIYLLAALLQGMFVLVSSIAVRTGALKAAEKLHKDMLYCILRTPLSFFDVTPLGRIINRFNHDIANIDEEIPFYLFESVQCFIWFTLSLIVIINANAFMAILIIVVIVIFAFLYKIYLWTSRQLNRLDSITRSPIYSHFNESISGAVSIRAYRVQQIFIHRLQELIDTNVNVKQYVNSITMWIDMWTTIIGTLITLSTALIVVFERDKFTPGLAGFVLIYSVDVISGISWALRMAADLENEMVSVERVREYTNLESEANWESTDEHKPDHNWPKEARIDFIDYSTSYRPGLEPVIKNLTFSVGSGEKVGIVGRTGAGKSSLTLALFRIIEPTNGRIVIDGIDVTKIGLHDLRSKITIIPQEPNLFAGTLRLNLDPFNEYSDEQLWTALERAHLKDFISTFSDGLSYEITESGDNLSAGQRQLTCLARALLRDTKILVLDEATAACDLETDSLIQTTIKEQFIGSTVLTIAHRLNTVLDYNTIIVLENGTIVEKDSPKNLLKMTDSVFYSLAKEFGIV